MSNSQQNTGDKIENLDFLFQPKMPAQLPRIGVESAPQEPRCNPQGATGQGKNSFLKRREEKTESAHSTSAAAISYCAPLQRPGRPRQNTPEKTADEYFEEGMQAYRNNDGPGSVSCFSRAAEAGNQYAMHNLGLLYEKGIDGVPSNSQLAVKWYKQSAQAGCNEAVEALKRMRELYPKYFGCGKIISELLHLPVKLIALVLTPVLIFLLYFLIPALLIWCRGNFYFFTLPDAISLVFGSIWGGVAVIVLILRLKKDFTSYFKKSVFWVEFCIKTISCVSDVVFVLGTGLVFCILEYLGINYLLSKTGFLAEHPNWSAVILWGTLLITGLLPFTLGATVSSAIVSTIKEKIHVYY